MKKTLIASAICLPPSLIGPAMMMGNLLKHFPDGSYCILMGRLEHIWCLKDVKARLKCKYIFSRYPFLGYSGSLFKRILKILRDIFALCEFFWAGIQTIWQEKIDSVFVVADHFVEIPMLLASRITGKKIILWLPDIYYRPDKSDWTRTATRLIEPFILKAVDTVLVTSEATQEYYKERHKLQTKILPHSVDISAYESAKWQKQEPGTAVKILYTGSVVKYNLDTILDMAMVVTRHPELNAEFIIISNNLRELQELRTKYPGVVCRHAKREEIPLLQQLADILFLPLSFNEHDAILRTASPSKLPEYLAAGRPILVYAPPSSYYARYAREAGFALVVDESDTALLYKAVERIKSDPILCGTLTKNAGKAVTEHHNAETISVRLQKVLDAV